jgi:ribosomal protein S7
MFNRFLGSLIKQGNKTAAKKILTTTLFDLSKKNKIPCYNVLPSIFKRLNNFVEIKKIP